MGVHIENNSNLLVTTPIRESWDLSNEKNIVFLGEWCKPHGSENLYRDTNHTTVNFYLKDRNKFDKDYYYLQNFYERVIASLATTLNDYHGVNHNVRYWRIIVGPWLITYISAIWNRWESLRIAFEENEFDETILLNTSTEYEAPSCHTDAVNLIYYNHLWNHIIYARILKDFYSSKIRIKYKSCNISKYYNNDRHNINIRKYTVKYKLASWIDRLLGIVSSNKIVFVTSYFKLIPLIKISFKIGQMPRLNTEFDNIINMPKVLSNGRSMTLDLKCDNQFESFIRDNIFLDAPVSFIEGYNCIKSKTSGILPNCKVIFDANSYWNNEAFKIWSAEKTNSGVKLIISEHGGSIQLKHQWFHHEEKISDKHVVWKKSINKNQAQLPPNIMIGRRKGNFFGDNLVVIGLELPAYGGKYSSGTYSSLTLEDFDQKLKFIDMLNSNIKKHARVRVQSEYQWNIGECYCDKLGKNVLSSYNNMLEAFDDSKIIVCTYPETTLLEAMHSEIPTILLFKEEYWEFNPELYDLVIKMKSANIIFSDPVSASMHINNIWSNPSLWWDSSLVKDARKDFFDQCGSVGEDWLDKWSMFLKKQLQD